MDPRKKRRKAAKPMDKKSRHDVGDRFKNIGKYYPSHKAVALEMLGDEEELNSDLDCDTQIEPMLSENALRQQRKLNRRRSKSNFEMAAIRKAAKDRIDICGGLQMELSEQDLFMQPDDPEPELADETIVEKVKTGRSLNIRQSVVLPIDHQRLTLAGDAKLIMKMEVIGCFLDLMAISYN
jgi:hypothetical protein